MEVVNSFKYLGFWFTSGNAYNKHLESLAARTRIAVNSVGNNEAGRNRRAEEETIYIYDVLCKSILSYGIKV